MANKKKLKFEHIKRPKVISQFGKLMLVGAVLLIVIGYIFWQAWVLLGPPQFKINSPVNGAKISEPFVEFSGSANSGTSISVNGSTISLNTDGTFNTNIPIKPGANKLYIHAANRTGKTKNTVLIIYYQ